MVPSIDLKRNNRLIVLVPDGLADNLDLAHKIYWIALRDQCEVLFLALVDDDERILTVSRCMATLKAFTSSNCLVVDSKITKTSLWLKTLREIYRPGDRIVCHEEQTVKIGFMQTSPLTKFLRNLLDAPVISISGFYHPEQVTVWRWFHAALSWLGLLLILAFFTFLEIQLNFALQGFVGKVLFCLVAIIEIGAIWTWNNITS